MNSAPKNFGFEGVSTISAAELARNPELFPDQPGIYAVVGKAAIPVLDLLGYYSVAESCHSFIGMDPILYVGAARYSSIRKRASDHLFGDARKSTFRQSLGIALAPVLNLHPVVSSARSGFHFGDGEAALSGWIQGNLSLTCVVTREPIALERQVVRQNHPPFNIKEREWDAFARQLSARRQAVTRRAISQMAAGAGFGVGVV